MKKSLAQRKALGHIDNTLALAFKLWHDSYMNTLTAQFTHSNTVLLRNALHARDPSALRLGKKTLPWSKLLDLAPLAAMHLPSRNGMPTVANIEYVTKDHPALVSGVKFLDTPSGAYQPRSRTVFVYKGASDYEYPQMAVKTVCHEFAHALMHFDISMFDYYFGDGTREQVECEADIAALSAIYLMGFQLPVVAFNYINSIVDTPAAKRVYHAIIDTAWEDRIQPAAEAIVAAFRKVL